MKQLTLTKREQFGWEVHMISDDTHHIELFDTEDRAKEYFLTMAKDLAV